ncbi:retrovirus-related Pol polyprotein from transposon 17.6 [Trichonephila clavipes]|uniref:RNA-directed DNA polymerase n=1 Tax=Trichonephila clavipes TaxID=2585209 RepID=A0A8X6T4Z3_TRICX|nr:retrovirus-related Pol polyprotein from transposon 17.6 [Trichonephila clavipes]
MTSSSSQKHLRNIWKISKKVFERLSIFKLHANRDKCHFACDRVKYLGFWITKKGIEADQDKISAIQKIPVPTNVKEVQSLLQTCSWFRRYVPNFADIARPLSSLTKKKVQWHWGPEQQESFETLKVRLMTPPILKQADGSKPFTIHTDASSYALGAVLLQGSGPDEHVIEYASRLMIPAERNYSTTEREALAVVWALEKFRGYVENQQIFLASDHQPLKWLLSIKSPSGRLARWALKIQSFNLKIDYTPGKANVVADMLSRPSYTEGAASDVCAITVDMPSKKSSDIRKGQLEDEELKKIIDCFESMDKDENFANYISRGYLMNQGILYRYSPESEEEAQLVVPAQERERIQEYHDAPTAGHYGLENTYKKISSRYYFQGMKKFMSTSRLVLNAIVINQKPAGLLRTPAYAQRFETLAVDLFGPLQETPTVKKWIFIVEDTSIKWVELFALAEATAENCAKTLIEEVLLRYGLPRRLISDNGPQFISAVMQLTCDLLEITQDLIPVYHPQANTSERKNRNFENRNWAKRKKTFATNLCRYTEK